MFQLPRCLNMLVFTVIIRVPLHMFTASLNYVALFPMKPDIVTVRSRMFFTQWLAGPVSCSLTAPEMQDFAPLFALVLP